MPMENIENAHLVAIDRREIFDFKQDELLNLSTWSAVWFSKAKRLYLQEVERRNSDLSYRLALVNFLNDIDEVSLVFKSLKSKNFSFFQVCKNDNVFVEVQDMMVIEALKYVKWNNQGAQVAYFINENYWMPFAKVYVRSNDSGFLVMLSDDDFKWKTQAIFSTEPEN